MSTYGVQYSQLPAEAVSSMADFRSDTVTKPCAAMLAAMTSAPLGDDVYGEDPTVSALEAEVAALMGMEAGVFTPSGTMSNLLAVLSHCDTRGSEALLGSDSHVFTLEQGGSSTLGGVAMRGLRNLPDGTFSLQELAENIRDESNCHYAVTKLVVVENTHNLCGGKVLPLEWLAAVRAVCDRQGGVKVHMDGARVCNAAVAMGVAPSVITASVHSVSVCLSKGLGAPVGAVLCGSAAFIARARRTRKALGGGMRQAGVIAAAALYAVRNLIPRLAEDHARAQTIARAVETQCSAAFTVDAAGVQSNLVFMPLTDRAVAAGVTAGWVMQVLEREHSVRVIAMGSRRVRAVTHRDLTDEHVHQLVRALVDVTARIEVKIAEHDAAEAKTA